MKTLKVVLVILLFLGFGISGASATSILDDWAFNVDETPYEAMFGDSMPTTGSLDSQGLGTLTWSTTLVGNHNFIAFFDHEADQATNTWYNEFGATNGAPAAGQSWEIDEPGYFFGDIYDNVFAGSLDNTNNVPSGLEDDVSMAIGWNFLLNVGETATISLLLENIEPGPGEFWLSQTDFDSGETIYFSSNLNIKPVPEPGTLLLIGTGLAGLAGWRRRRQSKK